MKKKWFILLNKLLGLILNQMKGGRIEKAGQSLKNEYLIKLIF
jgi:hypothetical protein